VLSPALADAVGAAFETMTTPHLFVVADVAGADDYHLGDEAMLEANLEMLRRSIPDVRFTVPSRDPAWTSTRYAVDGWPMPAVPAELLANDGLAARAIAQGAGWLGQETIDRLRSARALVISGGGNLCATWPDKILERAALMAVAQAHGLPVVVVGQTLGPSLTGAQRGLLATLLPSAQWVGVREAASARLAAELGVAPDRIDLQLDDAFFLASVPFPESADGAFLAARPRRVVVTLDASFAAPEAEETLRAIASQLDGIATWLDATLVFSPHVGGAHVPPQHDDRLVGTKLAALVRRPLVLLDLWQAREVRGLIESALFVVSARYHPLVFATAAGVPALAIHRDDYTRTKLRGALAPAGNDGWTVTADEAAEGRLVALAAELWSERARIRDRAAILRRDGWAAETRRWQAILRGLGLSYPTSLAPPPEPAAVAGATQVASMDPPAVNAPLISEAQWRSYDETGYLRLGRLLDPDALGALQARLDDIMLGRVRHPTLRMQRDTGGAYDELPEALAGELEATLVYRKVQGLEVDPLFLALLRHPIFREISARHYGDHASVSLFRAMMMNKPAGQGTYLPWHQDGGDVWKLDRDPLVTIWVALDDATLANGCLQVVPGTHRLGLLSRYGSTISDDHAAKHCPPEAITHLEVAAGEALLLHNWLIHRSDVNRTAQPRRAFTACYMDGRTIGTLTGRGYPLVFGTPEPVETALPYLGALHDEQRRLRHMHREVERYAKSLEAEVRKQVDAATAAEARAASATAAANAAAADATPLSDPTPVAAAASPRRRGWWRR
jgi:polysaccharide pyruvyl transferase WcaK-like protein